MSAALVLNTTYLSIIVQFVTGVIAAFGLFVPLNPADNILKSILLQETIVQVIEFFVYLILVNRFNLESMAATRYMDWFFTTPVMLFTMTVYYTYAQWKEQKKDTTNLTLKLFIAENYKNILLILLCNFGMLLFGYLGEIKMMNRTMSAVIGFAFFFAAFSLIYENYAKHSSVGKNLFTLMFALWSLYGVAFMLPAVWKNIIINFLDIIAKNFFGVFLFYVIYQKSRMQNAVQDKDNQYKNISK